MLGKFIGRGFSSITFTVDRFHLGAEPDSVVAEYRSTGTVAGSGASYANTYAGVFRVVGGRLAFWREFYDTQRAAAAAASFRKP
jgi:ketosteroid isomerase-like protein